MKSMQTQYNIYLMRNYGEAMFLTISAYIQCKFSLYTFYLNNWYIYCRYVHFDFHKICGHIHFEKLSLLYNQIEDSIKKHKYAFFFMYFIESSKLFLYWVIQVHIFTVLFIVWTFFCISSFFLIVLLYIALKKLMLIYWSMSRSNFLTPSEYKHPINDQLNLYLFLNFEVFYNKKLQIMV